VGAAAHPVGVRAEGDVGGPGAELAEKIALGFGIGRGARCDCGSILAQRIFATREVDSYVGGLDPGAVGEKEIAEGDGVGDAKGRLAIFVVGSDAILQGGQGLLDTFRCEAGRFCAGYCFSGRCSHPLAFSASRLYVALGLQEREGLLGFAAIDFEGVRQVADGPRKGALGVLEEAKGGVRGDGRKCVGTILVLARGRHAVTLS
jgi:hypothetical protein